VVELVPVQTVVLPATVPPTEDITVTVADPLAAVHEPLVSTAL
jgi:hypothetical protein